MPMDRKILVKEGDLLRLYPLKMKNRIGKAIKELKSAGLLPLRISGSESFKHFVHLLGLRYSDGCIYKQTRNNSYTFYICFGNKRDAERLVKDCNRIWGFSLRSCYGTNAYYVYLSASLARLMISIGSPVGRKTNQLFRVPKWVFSLPDSLKWEFLSGIFSGDGSAPKIQTDLECSRSLTLSLNSESETVEGFCKGFMGDLWLLLNQLGIKSSKPVIRWNNSRISKSGATTYPVVIRILTEKGNMRKFLGNARYTYSINHSRNSGIVLGILRGNKQISQLRQYLLNPSQNAPRICVFLGQPRQRELIEAAVHMFAENKEKGIYRKLAKHLCLMCENVNNPHFLGNKYLFDWKRKRAFIPVDCVVELARLCNIKASDIENDIKEVKFIRAHNKFAVPYRTI